MNTLILVNIAIIFIFSVADTSKTTKQILLSTGNNISVFDHHRIRLLQNRQFNNLLKNLLDLRKRAEKPSNKNPGNTNRPRPVGPVGRPKQKPSNKKPDNTNRPRPVGPVGRPKQKPSNKKPDNTNRPRPVGPAGRPKEKPSNKKHTKRPRRIGRPKPKRIIRGKFADIADFPYMASLVKLSPATVIASAIIVSDKFVVTHVIPADIYDLNKHFSDDVRILYQNSKSSQQWIHKINDIVDVFTFHAGRLVVIEVDRPFQIRFYKIAHFALDFNYDINSYVQVVGWELWDKMGFQQFNVDSLRYVDTRLMECDFHMGIIGNESSSKLCHKIPMVCNFVSMWHNKCYLQTGGIACWGDESAALVREGLIAGILVQKEKTCGPLANKTTDIYLKSKYIMEYVAKYIYTDVKYD